MEPLDEEEPDGLFQASFTIPSSSSPSKRTGAKLENAFPLLKRYERSANPSKQRCLGFTSQRDAARNAFESALNTTFDEFHARLGEFCSNTQLSNPRFFIPGSVKGESGSARLPSAALVGPQLSSQVRKRLREGVEDKGCGIHWVTLHPRECTTLALTFRLLLARLQVDGSHEEYDTIGLLSLRSLTASSIVIIDLPAVALHKSSVLNDLIRALHSCSQLPSFPTIKLLFSVEGGLSTLDNKLEPDSVQLMEMVAHTLPSPALAFENYMQELFTNPDSHTEVWLGPATLELLQYQYFQGDFDLDKVLSTIELAYHHHFTTRPLSALAITTQKLSSDDWEPVFFDRLRLSVLQADGAGKIAIPKQLNSESSSKANILRKLLSDNDALLDSLPDFRRIQNHQRRSFNLGIHLLHSLRSHYLNQAKDDMEELLLGPRRTRLGGLVFHILLGKDAQSLTSAVLTALRRSPPAEIERILEDIASQWQTSDIAPGFHHQARLKDLQSDLRREFAGGQNEESPVDESKLSEKEHVEAVNRRLLREQESEEIKRSIVAWCSSIMEPVNSMHCVLSDVWFYDFSKYLSQALDPSPRTIIVSALHQYDSGFTTSPTENIVPDICRLYQMYQSAGKMINLADWYHAFSHSVQSASTGSTSSPAKKRQRLDDEIEKLDSKDDIQARFALAVNELGRMGFLKKTRRKADHVLKVIHDLPPSNVS